MTLSERLTEYIRACFTGLWIQSHEHDDALAEMAWLCQEQQWQLVVWDLARGLHSHNGNTDAGTTDPLAAINSINALASADSSALLVLVNFHRFLNSAEAVQHLARQIALGKSNRTFVVILSPVVQIPTELEKQFVVVEHQLPGREQLETIARSIAVEAGELPTDIDSVLDAAAGLTRYEAEGAFSLSLVRHGRLQADAVWELKTQTLKKSGLLTLHRGSERFDDLGGLDSLKAFCQRAMRRSTRHKRHQRPRGVLLLGVPGTGKSGFAKALGNETSRPTLMLDVGSLLGSLVGQSEHNIRQALQIADAMAPCVIFVDEVEKALSGVASSGQTDSGVSARLFASFLTWLNDHESDVFVVCTANDVSKLPPEFSRAERFDGIFFLDLPNREQKDAIWRQYLSLFELESSQAKPDDELWTGAEVKACCRLAALLDVPLKAAAQNVVPVAKTAEESVERLRSWASGRCLDADRAGIYQRTPGSQSLRRRVRRGPENN